VSQGYLALVLHAHLPYVRHQEENTFLEEIWFFEALTETYIPLVQVFDGLINDGVDFRITVSLSPPLVSMLADPLLQQRYLRHLEQLITLAEKEVERTAKDDRFLAVAEMYLRRFREARHIFVEQYGLNLLQAFKKFHGLGRVEVITCSGTHGYLPLMLRKESMRAQVQAAVDLHHRHLGVMPRGIWLPECGYAPGVDEILKEAGLQFFFTDTHGIMFATPKPRYDVYAPLYTPAGVAAFGRDQETSRQVWDMHQGYPGDYYYREFYRDIGFDLDMDYIAPYIFDGRIRIDTGIKYYRITGKTDQKEPYQPDIARERAAGHAGNFMYNREKQVEHLAGRMDRPPIVVAPYDAELFGHWWYEGPQWLDFLIRKVSYDQHTFKLTTPWEYLNEYPTNQVASLPMSSWGHKGFSEVWLDPANDWIYRHLHKAEERMVELALAYPRAAGLTERALNQAARELMLAQSSDWAFIMKMQTAVEYAVNRTRDHLGKFEQLYHAIKEDRIDEQEIIYLEQRDNIFPDMNFRYYLPKPGNVLPFTKGRREVRLNRRVLMLSWEFPPKTVGGLARHVYDLTRAQAAEGEEIHVITCHVPGAPADEVVEGVFVHRVEPFTADGLDFIGWVARLNEAMVDCAHRLIGETGDFDLLHAHDWLVAHAGRTLKHHYGLPVIATIHATEYGRNHGIHNEMQRYISEIEWWLTYEAWRVIVCSKYMAAEMSQVFQLPADKIRIIPNGVDTRNVMPRNVDPGFRDNYAAQWEKMVYFIGRLVPEKGVQVLIDAVPLVLAQYPDAKFVISGKGPYEDVLKHQVNRAHIGHKVFFTGFADDETRNRIFSCTDVAVFPSLYEPFGIVALEAMAAGIPVIVSETGGLGEIIEHEVDGFKFYPGDYRALADYIVRLFRDGEQADRLRGKAWEKVTGVYNWSNIARDTVNVYKEVLAGTNKAVRA